tara:strand:- start:2047 stop:2268 length:222 start_codon:yes stop_codon:yes gene_type:complete
MTTPRKRQFRKLSAADLAILLGEVTTEAAPAPAIKKTAPAIKKTAPAIKKTAPAIKKTAPKTAAKPKEKTNTE